MPQKGAKVQLSNIAAALRKYGLTVVETPGCRSRGYAGQDMQRPRGQLWHHTATNRARFASADAPTLDMCINGRPDLPGPLCNLVLGRNGTVYVVAAGVANHAGRGSAPGIPKDAGNHYLIGIEAESSGIAPWDWTADQLRVAPILGAALELEFLAWLPAEERLALGHLEYSSEGKIDPAGWPGGMDGLRASINKKLAEPAGSGKTESAAVAAVPEEVEKMLVISKEKGGSSIWIGDGISRRQIPDTKTLEDLRKLARWGVLKIFKDGETMDYPLAALGEPVNHG